MKIFKLLSKKILTSISFPFAIFFLVSMLYNTTASAISLAELSYQLAIGSCPTQKVIGEEDLVKCGVNKTIQQNKSNIMSQISDDAYLAGLANIRYNSIGCAQTQIDGLEANPKKLEKFITIYTLSVIEIGLEKRMMSARSPFINTDKKAKEDYTNARLRAEAILASLPFTQIPSLRLTINHIVSQIDYSIDPFSPEIEKDFEKLVKYALQQSKKEIIENKEVMRIGVRSIGKSLSNTVRESLAQDTDLIEEFKQNSGMSNAQLAPSACSVDAKYGRGASYRDDALLIATILGPEIAIGLEQLGKAGIALKSSITGAAAMGTFSIRTAGVLRLLSTMGHGLDILKQIEKSCFAEVTLKSDHYDQKCEKNIIKSLGNDTCALDIFLGALGAKSILGHFKLDSDEIIHPIDIHEYFHEKAKQLSLYNANILMHDPSEVVDDKKNTNPPNPNPSPTPAPLKK